MSSRGERVCMVSCNGLASHLRMDRTQCYWYKLQHSPDQDKALTEDELMNV